MRGRTGFFRSCRDGADLQQHLEGRGLWVHTSQQAWEAVLLGADGDAVQVPVLRAGGKHGKGVEGLLS